MFKRKIKNAFRPIIVLLVTVSLITGVSAPVGAYAGEGSSAAATEKAYSAEEIYSTFSPYVVEIKTWDSHDNIYIGTGFFVSRKLVLTNYHVIEAATAMAIYDSSGVGYPVQEIYAIDTVNDLALIRVTRHYGDYLEFATEEKPGEQIYCIGSPAALSASMVTGIVSRSKVKMDGVNYVQISMPSGTGIGGGPILNKYGKVLGVMCLTVSTAQNISLAVSYDVCSDFVKNASKAEHINAKTFYRQHPDSYKESNYFEISDYYTVAETASEYESQEAPKRLEAEEIYAQAYDAMVDIMMVQYYGSIFQKLGTGSGFFISEDTVVTNCHVVEGAELVFVEDYNGQLYDVKKVDICGVGADIATLTVAPTDEFLILEEDGTYRPIDVRVRESMTAEKEDVADSEGSAGGDKGADSEGSGTSDSEAVKTHGILKVNRDYIPRVGETIYAMGSPASYTETMSTGIVSMSTRRIDDFDYINITAPIYSGSSGGVLMNVYGEAIGVVTLMTTVAENCNFAIQAKYIP